MKSIKIAVLITQMMSIVLLPGTAGANPAKEIHHTPRTTIRIISEVEQITPGQPFWIGMLFKMIPDWHIYWQNPGDAGLAPSFTWQLPEGFTIDEPRWPYPETIMLGGLANFGYEDQVLILFKVTPPENIPTDQVIPIGVEVDWLVCKEECIPESADLTLDLMVRGTEAAADPQWQDIFNTNREKLPLKDIGWTVTAGYTDTAILIRMIPPAWFKGQHGAIRFYPLETEVIENAGEQVLTPDGEAYLLAIPRNLMTGIIPDTLSGVLVSAPGWRGPGSEKALCFKTPVVESEKPEELGFLWAILFAFAGGIILNLMPCVLPVLSLKIFGFIRQAGEDRRRIFFHGAVFTAGVVISFLVLAAILILLQAGGAQLGWGFQLQSPGFILILSMFLFVFALNLFGVFEAGTSVMGIGQKTAGRGGWPGSFMSGITATIVATPCTAPFMGSALGYAITQPAAVSLSIFASLGFGMAAPYLLISAVPGLLRFVPKPGPWMETLKQFMGFLLVGTVIWLIWVFNLQTGSNGILIILTALLMTAIAAWILGKWGLLSKPAALRRTAWISSILLIGLTIVFGLKYIPAVATRSVNSYSENTGLDWQPYSEELYHTLRQSGEPFLIDFTAAWCLSCQVNEKVAFGAQEVTDKISDLDLKLLKADWTRKDPVITRALAKYGRNSVPLYVLYGKETKNPVILPEILTPAIVLEALNNIN